MGRTCCFKQWPSKDSLRGRNLSRDQRWWRSGHVQVLPKCVHFSPLPCHDLSLSPISLIFRIPTFVMRPPSQRHIPKSKSHALLLLTIISWFPRVQNLNLLNTVTYEPLRLSPALQLPSIQASLHRTQKPNNQKIPNTLESVFVFLFFSLHKENKGPLLFIC